MGGKTNQVQRTKNSVRPSSSGRSAEFLQGASSYTFSGFQTTGGDNSAAKTTFETSINEEIALIDPNIQVVLKKLTKKDAVTKAKALLELAQLVEESDLEIVKAVVPLWPRMYKNLYADISHRVRECCQQAHKAFVVKMSKGFAPILKQLCAEWIASQFDTYAPAASVAKGSLANAFPAHKLKDVLAFCHDEILDYIHRMLLVPMPMPADKSYTPEEYEARSERLVYMGLYTYIFYLCNIETGLWKEKVDKHQAIFADGKFWSYAKHKTPQVKAAWLEAIGAILDKTSGLLDEFYPKIVSSVVNNLDEGDALVQGAAWTCLLRIQLIVPNWVEHTSVEKALLVKLRKVLSQPNQGLVTHLLPFISHMNQKTLGTHCPRFFRDFFESLKTAIHKPRFFNVQALKVLVETYFECLHFVLKKIQLDKEFIEVEDKDEWKKQFVNDFLVSPIQWTVWENGRALDHVARNVGLVLGYWSANEESYRDLWTTFWEITGKSVFLEDLADVEKSVSSLGYQIQLVINLRSTDMSGLSASSPRKKPKKVTFGGRGEDEEKEEDEPVEVQLSTLRSNNWEELFSIAYELSQRCLRQMTKSPNPVYIKLLYKLLSQFNDPRLVHSIDKAMSEGARFEEKVLEWISDERIASVEMVDLLMSYGVKSLPLNEIVDKLMAVDNDSVRSWTMKKVLKDKDLKISDFQSISVHVEHLLLRLINGVSSNENSEMLQMYFDIVIRGGESPTEGHKAMIDQICNEIDRPDHPINSQLNSLARFLLTRIEGSQETITQLFLTVFQMNLNGVDSEANQSVLQDVINKEKVPLLDQSKNLSTVCMEMIQGKMNEMFAEDNFQIDFVLQSCLLFSKREDFINFTLPYITTKKTDDYLEHLYDISGCLTDGIKEFERATNKKAVTSENHFRSLMSTVKSATLKMRLMEASGVQQKDTDQEIVKVLSFINGLKYKELEDNRLVAAIEELVRTGGDALKETLTEFAALESVKTKEQESSSDNNKIAANLSSLRLQLATRFESNQSMNTVEDKMIIRECLDQLNKIIPLSRARQLNLQYNATADQLDDKSLWLSADLAGVLRVLVQNSPSEFTPEQWDFLRIALSSWILTISNFLSTCDEPRLPMFRFIVSVMRLFEALMTFFASERQKSSTQLFCKVIEEWTSVFAREVNTVLLLVLHKLLSSARTPEKNKYLLLEILPCFEQMNFIYLIVSKDISKNLSQHQFLTTLFGELSHPTPTIRYFVLRIAHCVIPHLVSRDNDQLAKSDSAEGLSQDGHYLATAVAPLFEEEAFNVNEFIEEFQYKFTELAAGETIPAIDEKISSAYFYLWNVTLAFCRKASPELRAFYAKWIAGRGMEGVLLKMIFRLLPQDVVRTFETKSSMVDSYFNAVKSLEICDKSLNTEQLVCYTYLNLVRFLPAVVRKCWTNLPHRTNLLIEKFNMFYASALLCQEELRTLMNKREKMDNIQISVHNSTREIIAVYAKEEARMELMITLPLNYPLAVAKVEGGKSVNSRIQSKEVLMQLNLFLSHQNGTIFNGLSLWKRNLDKKFDGVEECYVCYSVIHQDTYQLPKLTCKTCKKKFHSPCLYRWFSTSNKSTCPICRNIF